MGMDKEMRAMVWTFMMAGLLANPFDMSIETAAEHADEAFEEFEKRYDPQIKEEG